MGTIISFANQKGGVGKTTCVMNIGAYLASKGYKVLLIDDDPQGNLTTGFGIMKNELILTLYDVFTGRSSASEAIIPTNNENLYLIPGTSNTAGCESELLTHDDRNNCLKTQLSDIKDTYDFILIDCPPALGLITINAFNLSNAVIIPMIAEFLALEGLSQLKSSIDVIRCKYNPALSIMGIIFTMFDSRLKYSNDILAEVQKFFPNQIFDTKIPRDPKLSISPSHSMTIFDFEPDSVGAKAYQHLCEEILNKMKGEN